VSVCTDGAANMTGKYSGVVSKIKNAANIDLLIYTILNIDNI